MASIDQLKLFVRIAELLSVSHAARDRGIPQPTASRWVAQLEADFGHPLLRRSSRKVSLTEAGEKVLAYARSSIDDELSLRRTLEGEDRSLRGKLRIAAPAGFGTLVVLPIAAAFQRENLNIEIDLRLSDRFVDFVAENIDMSVRIGELESSQLVQSRIATLEEVIACHPELAVGLDREDPEQVERLTWFRLSALRHGTAVDLIRDKKKLTLNISPRLWIDSGLALRRALLERAGATLLHHYVIADDLERGSLVQLLPGWKVPSWPVWIVLPPGKKDPRVDAFTKFLKHRLKYVLGDGLA